MHAQLLRCASTKTRDSRNETAPQIQSAITGNLGRPHQRTPQGKPRGETVRDDGVKVLKTEAISEDQNDFLKKLISEGKLS